MCPVHLVQVGEQSGASRRCVVSYRMRSGGVSSSWRRCAGGRRKIAPGRKRSGAARTRRERSEMLKKRLWSSRGS